MNNLEVSKYQIRNYSNQDASTIGAFDKVLELSYRYNPDFIPDNIFCAGNSEGDLLGVGHLEPHDTWHLIDQADVSPDFVYKLIVRITLNPQFLHCDSLKENLLKRLIDRAKEIQKQYPDKKIRVFTWLSAEDNDEIDFFLSQGFISYQTSLVLKFDLTQDIPDVPQPEGITVIPHKMDTEEELRQYHAAASIAFSGVTWSLNYVRWLRGGPEWVNFSAFSGSQLVGNTMTWMITGERSATEDIFVLPEWRNKGVARYVITEALRYLKRQGKAMATLSVHGDNKKAISLYKSLGYKMFGMMIEFGVDL